MLENYAVPVCVHLYMNNLNSCLKEVILKFYKQPQAS